MAESNSYYSELGQVLVFVFAGAVFIAVMLLVARLIRPNRPNPEKTTTYESGEDPVSSAWPQFNLGFYVVAIVFILFEVELVFLFPWAVVFADKELIRGTVGLWGWLSFVEMLIFILILGLGLAYVWVNGHLDWIKPKQTLPEFKSPVPPELYEDINKKYG